jgi:hypothetical protein
MVRTMVATQQRCGTATWTTSRAPRIARGCARHAETPPAPPRQPRWVKPKAPQRAEDAVGVHHDQLAEGVLIAGTRVPNQLVL